MNGAGLALFIFVGVVMVFGIVYTHEQTHIAIFDAYGVDSDLKWGIRNAVVTGDSEDVMSLSETDRKTLRALNAVTEIVTYQYFAVFAMQFLILMMMVILKNERRPNT